MKSVMFSIRDRKSGIYGTPYCSVNEECGKRDFLAFCKMPANAYIADDLELYKIGVIESETGVIEADEKPIFVMNGVSDNG